jgi:cell wall-associated NlpC family hydrolase
VDAIGPRRRRRRPVAGAVALVLAATGLAVSPVVLDAGDASAEPAPRVRDVQKRLSALEVQAAQASEDYNASRERIAGLKVRIGAAEARVTQQQKRVESARRDLGRLAVETYKGAGLSSLELFLGDDPDDALARTTGLVTLTERRAEAVQRLQRERDRLAAALADVQAQNERLAASRGALGAARERVLAAIARTRTELGRLQESELAAYVRVSRAGDREALTKVLGRAVGSSERVGCDDVKVAAPNARVEKVLDYACAQLGKPYRWGGAGPRSFDCSGFSQQAWARVGVSLPHNAAMQSRYGTRVAPEDLRPGDLVFYNSPISHMGIYIGSGLMIHAPQTGDVIKISGTRYKTLVAATRL